MLKNILFAGLSFLSLWLAWYFPSLSFLSMLGFVPLLLRLHQAQKPFKALAIVSPVFLIYNLCLLYPLAATSLAFFLHAALAHAFLQLLTFVLFLLIKKQLGNQRAYLSLPFIWLLHESFLAHYDYGLPMFNLGNVLASYSSLVNWYALLGHSAGSLWIWFINLSLFGLLLRYQKRKSIKAFVFGGIGILLLIGTPIIGGGILALNIRTLVPQAVNVLVIQPDAPKKDVPLNQLNPLLKKASSDLNPEIDLLILPNTAQFKGLNEGLVEVSPVVEAIRAFQVRHSNTPIHFQGTSLRAYTFENTTSTAVPRKNGPGFMDLYRSSFLVSPGEEVQIRHQQYYAPVFIENQPQNAFEQDFFTSSNEAQPVFEANERAYASYGGRDMYLSEVVRQSTAASFILLSENPTSPYTALPLHIKQGNAKIRAVENGKPVFFQTEENTVQIGRHGSVGNSLSLQNDTLLFSIIPGMSHYYARAGNVMERIAIFIIGFISLFVLVKLILPKKSY
jgi:apolipoprotein N-acyltransferase